MLRLFRLLAPYRRQVALVLVLAFAQSLGTLIPPRLIADIVDRGIVRGDQLVIVEIGSVMLLVSVIATACAIAGSYVSAKVATGFGRTLRGAIFARASQLSLHQFDHYGAASLITRTTNDTTQVQQMLIMLLTMVIAAPMMAAGGILLALSQDTQLAWVLIAVVPIMAAVFAVIMRGAVPLSTAMQGKIDRLNLVLSEGLSGVRVIRAFDRGGRQRERFDDANRDTTDTAIAVNRLIAILMPMLILMLNLTSAAIVWVGSHRIDQGVMELGTMIAALQYSMQILFAVFMVTAVFVMLPRASASAARINDVLDRKPEIVDPAAGTASRIPAHDDAPAAGTASRIPAHDDAPAAGPASRIPAHDDAPAAGPASRLPAHDDAPAAGPASRIPAHDDAAVGRVPRSGPAGHDPRGRVEFRDVTFQYPGAEEPALSAVSFVANPGEVTAIIGGTGSGKSTLAGLIPRFYDVNGGRVLIDGVDVRDLPQAELRGRIGFVPQKAVLFTGTVAANIRYGRDEASDEQVRHAATIAQALDFVEAMPDRFASTIAQGGINLSGGQKQRLAIARAIVRRPDIYVFDDSFSALDFGTEARLRTALRDEIAIATVFIVAQRISTVISADRIIVLDNGRVTGIGTHAELLERSPVYREIVASQVSLDEVA